MKKAKSTYWPTQEELEIERRERWNNLPKKIKSQFIENWREFALAALNSYLREARKKLKLSIMRHGKN